MAFLNTSGLERLWSHINLKLNNKVDKVEGHRLITTSEASKLEALVLGDTGQVEISGKVNSDNVEGLDEKLALKVDKVTGKDLSTNDYTTADKNKLAGIADGANKTVVDSALSDSSTNPVQNKVINAAINDLNILVGDTSVSEQIGTAIVDAGVLTIDTTDAEEGTANLINADTVGGLAADSFVLETEFNDFVDTEFNDFVDTVTNDYALKSDYVKKSGDTMSGNLNIRRSSLYPGIAFGSTQQATNDPACQIETNLTDGNRRIYFMQFHQDMDGASTRYKDIYTFPNATSGLTANKTYNILTTKSPVTVAQGGTGATTAPNARTNLGMWKTLWSGSWSSGTITVPNTSDYNIFKIAMDGQGTTVLAIRQGDHIRGVGGYSTNTPTPYTFHFTATYSGNTWTFVACNSMTHSGSGNHGSITNRTVSSIVGVI